MERRREGCWVHCNCLQHDRGMLNCSHVSKNGESLMHIISHIMLAKTVILTLDLWRFCILPPYLGNQKIYTTTKIVRTWSEKKWCIPNLGVYPNSVNMQLKQHGCVFGTPYRGAECHCDRGFYCKLANQMYRPRFGIHQDFSEQDEPYLGDSV